VLVLLAVAGLAAGPWLAVVAARLAARDRAARPSAVAVVVTALLAGVLVPGAWVVGGARPATAALVWLAGTALVLGATDLAAHRLPDVVTFPAYAVCAAALVVDAAVLDAWPALLRAVLAAATTFAVGAFGAYLSPEGLGFGDVKLLGLLGLVLGWAGWEVLAAGIFVGLLAGALGSLVLLATRRAGWRTAIPFGPPLLLGAAVALALAAPLPLP
jgi:leader peptidase (prepilin peptidase)/N-methyltransferase